MFHVLVFTLGSGSFGSDWIRTRLKVSDQVGLQHDGQCAKGNFNILQRQKNPNSNVHCVTGIVYSDAVFQVPGSDTRDWHSPKWGRTPTMIHSGLMASLFLTLSLSKSRQSVFSARGVTHHTGVRGRCLFPFFPLNGNDRWRKNKTFSFGRDPLSFLRLAQDAHFIPQLPLQCLPTNRGWALEPDPTTQPTLTTPEAR